MTYLDTDVRTDTSQIIVSVEYSSDNPSIRQLIEQFSCYPVELVVVQDGVERWQVRGESNVDLRKLIEAIEGYENSVELLSRTGVRESETGIVPIAPPTDLLTTKQRETLHKAFTLGYYSSDSETTIEKIGKELDVHPTTAWEHLKKAENKLINNYCSLVF
ncbi:helix-turn-helix domain-containing protein [Haladaptatus cibarius]|uniref:helix-turn-helix domain-containing protein n=1 Tax=Haladaptatus cibarius TaxID=453847 RepID=UPI00130DAC4C|nr:helix-turn-helix domain-containing protein [Haladaptatus cibarius]